MRTLVLLALVGFGAQLVDGSLGMAYGVTSTTLLLAIGTNPAAASATVHLAEIGTTPDVRRLAHWKFGNVDWKVVAKIGIPGAVGAFVGATVLSSLSTEVAAPVMSIILLSLGVYILIRFTLRGSTAGNLGKPLRKRFLGPLGLVGRLRRRHRRRRLGPGGHSGDPRQRPMEPRKVIGSIDTSVPRLGRGELGFIAALGAPGIDSVGRGAPRRRCRRRADRRVAGAAHPAAHARLAVGGIIVLTNTRTLLRATGSPPPTRPVQRLRGALRGV